MLGLWLDDLLNDPGPVSEVEEADIARVLGLQVLVGVREIPSYCKHFVNIALFDYYSE